MSNGFIAKLINNQVAYQSCIANNKILRKCHVCFQMQNNRADFYTSCTLRFLNENLNIMQTIKNEAKCHDDDDNNKKRKRN
jgi:hypothetical protein